MKNKLSLQIGIVTIFIVLAALSRLLPHPPNFTPIGGMALFGAAYFTKKYWAFIIPLAALWFSDLLLNNVVYAKMFPEYYEGFVWFSQGGIWIYSAFILIVLMGFINLKRVNLQSVSLNSVFASIIFFLVSNFGTWMSSGMYPKTIAGLGTCYAMGVPFFWNTLAGDLFFSAVLFGGYAFVQNRFLQPQQA